MAKMRASERPKDKPLSVWKEKDSIDGTEVTALVMILNTPGCWWAKKGGCSMCGYNVDGDPGKTSTDQYVSQMRDVLQRYKDEPYIKIFTSGSFLDPGEVQEKAQNTILRMIREHCGGIRVLFETRPEFITEERLSSLSDQVEDLEVAIGLESADDHIRTTRIRKGFTWYDYLKGGRVVVESGLSLKTYLLLKPPLTGEQESIEDTVGSIGSVSREFPLSRISINPMNIQRGTEVEQLFKRGLYKPPWLWSLVDTLIKGKSVSGSRVHLMSSPTGGGKKRGAHNCGRCDEAVLKGIERFSIDNDPTHLDIGCKCWEEYWKYIRVAGELSPSGSDLLDPRKW
jgi:radical SAM enzyme (TIGR01210 family)